MRMVLLSLLTVAALGLLVACDDDAVRGSGIIETLTFELASFDQIEAHNTFHVEVTAGPGFEVVVEADDNVVDRLIVEVRDRRLVLGLQSGNFDNLTLEARVSAPDLVRIDASGASRVELFDFTSRVNREIDVSGASEVLGTFNALDLDVEASGASRAILSGAVDRLEVGASEASRIAMRELAARVARIDFSGASSGTVTVTDVIERVELSGASALTYFGDPRLEDVSTSGASSIREG